MSQAPVTILLQTLLLSAVLALPAAAAQATPTNAAPATPTAVAVRFETELGAIDVAIDLAHAPLSAANFLRYVDAGRYDGGRFHRTVRPDIFITIP